MTLCSRRLAAPFVLSVLGALSSGCAILSIEEVPLPLAASPPPAASTPAAQTSPSVQVTPASESATPQESWPCEHARGESITADCFQPNADQRALVGSECALHPGSILRGDTVPIHYGFAGSPQAAEVPGVFINSRVAVGGGCVVGKPWTEVAYCPECRRARTEWEAKQMR